MFQYPIQYPAIESTREMAEARGPDTVFMACVSCKTKVGFQSNEERDRFVSTSGWAGYDDAAICPVCREKSGRPKE